VDPLQPDTLLARFTAGKDVRAEQKPRVKESFLLPRWDDGASAWALSTSRVDGLNSLEMRAWGEAWVHKNLGPSRTLKARCCLPVRAFLAQGLQTDFDDEPPRHVNVLGWPDAPEDRIAIALELCREVEESGHIERY